MEDKLLKIINYYGVDNQQRKLEEEVFELQQAISLERYGEDDKDHIIEEIGDVFNLLDQFVYYYELDVSKIVYSRMEKIDRTLGDIEE